MHKKLLSLALTGFLLLSAQGTALAASDSSDPTSIEFEVSVDGATKSITLSQLGVTATEVESDKHETLSMILSWFGQASLLESLHATAIDYDFTWSELRTENMVRTLWDLETPKNARFIQSEGVLNIEAEVSGVDFEVNELLESITEDYPNFKSYELDVTETEVVTAEELVTYFGQVQDLLEKGLTVSVSDQSHQFPAQLKDVVVSREAGSVQVSLNTPYLDYVVNTLDSLTESEASDLVISSVPSGLGKATVEGRIQNGQSLDRELTEKMISGAMTSGKTEATAVVNVTPGQILNQSGQDLGDMELLSSGISDFATSPSGRDFNVRKALNEHFNGIVIPAGESFHFNQFLGPVTYSAGWQGSLAIFNGNELRTVPGGGICQTSTTVYRAALNAGLDIEEQRNHSLYVHYYEAYGDGLDSTIFPGSQDLVFKNNTDGPILVEAYAEGTIATVNFYGTSDGRQVDLFGPYTQSNQTDEVIAATGGLGYNQIAWKQVITWPNGIVKDDWRLATYRGSVTQY